MLIVGRRMGGAVVLICAGALGALGGSAAVAALDADGDVPSAPAPVAEVLPVAQPPSPPPTTCVAPPPAPPVAQAAGAGAVVVTFVVPGCG